MGDNGAVETEPELDTLGAARRQPVDLGVIEARPLEPDGAARGGTPGGAPGPVDTGGDAAGAPGSGGLGGAVAGLTRDVLGARRGPRPNSRPVPEWVRSLAWVLDDSVPIGGGRRVGLDGLVGLVPAVGDAAGLVASMVVVLAGVAAGVSLPTLTLMLVHVGIDTIVGTVPFLGAVFDLGYKANTRNLRLIERDLGDRSATKRSSIRVFVLAGVALVAGWLLFLIALVGGTYLFVRLVSGLL